MRAPRHSPPTTGAEPARSSPGCLSPRVAQARSPNGRAELPYLTALIGERPNDLASWLLEEVAGPIRLLEADLDQSLLPLGPHDQTPSALVETGTAWDTDALQGLGPVARAAKAFSFRSTHRQVKAYDRDWPAGAASPGLVQVSFMREPESMDASGAAAYWVEHHAPLAVRVHVGLWRYAQNVLDEAITVGAPGWYGVAELHFASWADFETKFYDSDDGRDAIFADVARFLDVRRSTSALMTERILRS